MTAAPEPGATDHDVVIIGAGPAGLSAAYEMARAGRRPLIVERTDRVGGLMRSIRWGDAVVDLGRKELYTRIPEVDRLWRDLLGEEYRPYPHRVGSLYRGHVVELSGAFRGVLRGVPPHLLARGAVSLARGRLRALAGPPDSYEAHWHGRVGEEFARLFAQGYWEKFRGVPWAAMPPPGPGGSAAERGGRGSYSQRAVARALRPFSARAPAAPAQEWRHPRLGTGQLFDRLHHEAARAGAEIRFSTCVDRIELRPDGAWQLDLSAGATRETLVARRLVSSLAIEALANLLHGPDGPLLQRGADAPALERRHVLLVYLKLPHPPRFAHAWLEVNDPDLLCGRITNYAGFGGDMVPDGRGCVCVEFFCSEGDALLGASDDALVACAVAECSGAHLFETRAVEDAFVLRLARTNAASSWRELQGAERRALLSCLPVFDTLYHVNRPGSDWASYAGLLAARAILSGSREGFERLADPLSRLPEREAAQADAGPRPAAAGAG
jgi:protoporphyrinogen oxidase